MWQNSKGVSYIFYKKFFQDLIGYNTQIDNKDTIGFS